LARRLPKFGFKNFNRKEYKGINLDVLQQIVDKQSVGIITREVFIKSGYASKNDLIKILGRGELKAKLEVSAHAFSATAKKAIEELGGTTNII
jgi:large subunit ribosomal protein L15